MDQQKEETLTTPGFYLGDWFVEPDLGRISREETEIRLEPKVMSVLLQLATHPGQVMSRDAIEAAVWKDVVVGYDALASTIIKLRKALGDNSRSPRYIETVSKKGYRLIAAVRNAPDTVTTPNLPKAGSRPSYRVITAISALLIIFGLIGFYWHELSSNSQGAKATPHGLVVLPFTYLGDKPQQDYFSDGITEDLIIDLSRYSGLTVVSPRTAFSFKTRTVDFNTLSEELGVRYVVEGSVRLDDTHLRVNVQLIDASSGIYLWAERYDREVSGLFDVQDEVRQKIISALEITLTKEERTRQQQRYTNSFEAYDLFLRGQAQLVRRASKSDNEQAMDLMQRAIEIDPAFSRAHTALALIYADAYRFDWSDDPEQTRRRALESGQHAIELDDQSPQAYWILGYIYLFLYEDHDRAVDMATRALELNPTDPDAVTLLAVAYAYGDNPQKAKLLIQELMQKNRYYSAMVPSVLGLANLRLGHYAEALSAYDKSLLINPSRLQGNIFKVLVLYRMGRTDDAQFQVDELYTLHPNFKLSVWISRQPFKDKQYSIDLVNDLQQASVATQ